MNTALLDPPSRFIELPADLRSWSSERQIVEWALDAAHVSTSGDAGFGAGTAGGFSSQMLLTLLTYCYSTGVCGSEDIEWAAENDPTVRYICARAYPDWPALRQFRKRNRQCIEQCLAYVLARAVERQCTIFGSDTTDPSSVVMCVDAVGWARGRVGLAILIDAATSD